jgi:phage-related tail fiber protein
MGDFDILQSRRGFFQMRSRQEIERILATEIEEARLKQKEAGETFRQIAADIPSLLPAPDGALRIHQAGTEYRAALDNLRNALHRYNDFIAKGIVPEDVGGWRIR